MFFAKRTAILYLGIFFCALCTFASASTIDYPEGILSIPAASNDTISNSLIIAFSPNGDAQGMINYLSDVAQRHGWFIFASREYRRDVDIQPVFIRLIAAIDKIRARYPINPSCVVAYGFADGAIAAHAFSFLHPQHIAGVLANTGTIGDQFISERGNCPQHKYVVFFASPTDFYYHRMQRDRTYLEGCGWRTLWIEFAGGRVLAPKESLEGALSWFDKQFFTASTHLQPRVQLIKKIDEATGEYRFNGVIVDTSGRYCAIVNGQPVYEGESLGPVVVTAIAEKEIFVTCDGKLKRYALGALIRDQAQ